ncbi:MAG TPA: tetratricopeptide repeat protein [Polyangium sp.]|nr:tetratricopeptide repeat protein [Polyangium sp.]
MSRPAKRPAKKASPKPAAPSRRATKNTPAAAEKPPEWKTLNDRGSDHTMAGRFDKALADFNAAIKLAPNEALPFYNRGATKYIEGDVEGAIEDFTAAIERNPEFVQAYVRRGEARHDLEDLDGSLTDFDTALRLSPDEPDALAQRATVRAERTDLEGAVQDIERALAIAPSDWEMLENAKEILATLRKLQTQVHEHQHPQQVSTALGAHAHEEHHTPPTSVIEGVLAEMGWKFAREDDGNDVVDYLLQMDESTIVQALMLRLSEQFQRLVFYVLFRPKAKKDHRAQLCEFIARANYGMGDGNFEMDFDDGSVRFRVSLDFSGVSLPGLLVRNMVFDGMNTVELYQQSLARVIAGKAKAKAAVQAAEKVAMERGVLQ